MGKVFDRIYKEVKKIPKGEVAAYGEIARKVGTTPRVVGFALHQNPDPKNIPCHRVGGMGQYIPTRPWSDNVFEVT